METATHFLAAALVACAAMTASGSARAAKEAPALTRCVLLETEAGTAERFKAQARHTVAGRLRDAQSARFKDDAIYARAACEQGVVDVVCQSVNAKNGFGGYTGFDSYVYIQSGARFTIYTGPQKELTDLDAMIAALDLCVSARHRTR